MSFLVSSESVASLLKTATHEKHQQAENILFPRLSGTSTKNDYAAILKMFYGYFHPVEKLIELQVSPAELADINERRKSGMILEDLSSIGESVHDLVLSDALPQIDGLPGALGAMYVLEGSTLGGRMIAKMLLRKPSLGLSPENISFFNGYGEETGPRWINFQKVINQYQRNADKIIDAANQTFSYFSEWINKSL